MKRRLLIFLHDLIVTAAAVIATFYIRFEEPAFADRWHWLPYGLPLFLVYAGAVYHYFDLYRGKWRFASIPDLFNIFRAATVLAVSLLVLDYVLIAPQFYGTFFFGKISIALYWILQIFLLGAARFAYRYFRYVRTRQRARSEEAVPVLIAGRAADADVVLRAVESGGIKRVWPAGILSPSEADLSQSIRGVPVMGRLTDVERAVNDLAVQGIRVSRIVLLPSAFAEDAEPEVLAARARRLGIACSRLPSLDGNNEHLRFAPIPVEDLLLRPTVEIDYGRLRAFVQGRSVVVTGGGGSIGSELCNRVVTFGAARLLIVESSELALHSAMESLGALNLPTQIVGRIADIRDRPRIMQLMTAFKPDLVFHAAALKHLPLLEQDWDEGVKTNVFGSVNVADAAVEAGAEALVMISTDKAVEPVSVLGATKRLAEMYCQALDAELARRTKGGRAPTRIVSVRFGNVLASTGSVVPKFKAQIEAGGPVTITHPDMVRYFMTIREACDLVVTAGSHALSAAREHVLVYELSMGQPMKIVDLAERMIRLAGLEPGQDVEIVFTGMRPGERLHEFLSTHESEHVDIGIDGVVGAASPAPNLDNVQMWLAAVRDGLSQQDRAAIDRALRQAVPSFRGAAA